MAMSVTEISQGLAAGKFSSVEVTQDYLARIAQFNPALNCFISVTDELALAQARQADARLAKGEAGRTHRCAARAQGFILHRWRQNFLRLPYSGQLYRAIRRNRHRTLQNLTER